MRWQDSADAVLTRRLSLASDFSEVTRLNDWLDEAFVEAGVAPGAAEDLKLCLNEAVANTMLYAFSDEADPQIEVEIRLDATSASAVLTDNGIAFDPLVLPEREKPTDLESAKIGGFGVQLIRQTASSVDYQRVDGQNRLHIVCGTPS